MTQAAGWRQYYPTHAVATPDVPVLQNVEAIADNDVVKLGERQSGVGDTRSHVGQSLFCASDSGIRGVVLG